MRTALATVWHEMAHAMRHAWYVLRNVLRGYFQGQSPDDERPHKGCC